MSGLWRRVQGRGSVLRLLRRAASRASITGAGLCETGIQYPGTCIDHGGGYVGPLAGKEGFGECNVKSAGGRGVSIQFPLRRRIPLAGCMTW